jgi:hypothetical protein
MSEITLQKKINERKRLYLQQLKEQGNFVEYCPSRGYIYELVQPIQGCITHILIALKNGVLQVLEMNSAEGVAA